MDLNVTGATLNNPDGLAIDPQGNRVYWANASGNKISFANLDGTGSAGDLNTTGATLNGPIGVAVDRAHNKIYWANTASNKISFANFDNTGSGGDLTTTGATVDGLSGIAIDPGANKIYWANQNSGKISFANLDNTGAGGDLDTTGATSANASFAALLRKPNGTAAPAISGAPQIGSSLSCSQGTWSGDLIEAFLYRVPVSFAYQWQKDGQDVGGATTASFVPQGAGHFTCKVTAANRAGTTSQTSTAVSVAAN